MSLVEFRTTSQQWTLVDTPSAPRAGHQRGLYYLLFAQTCVIVPILETRKQKIREVRISSPTAGQLGNGRAGA